MSGTQERSQQDGDREPKTLECGHDSTVPHVSLPGVGGVCRNCHTPIRLNRWQRTLRRTETHHHTGETTHYSTWLVGLDEYGRAVYHDEYNGQILKIVPKHHRVFSDDVDAGADPVRAYPGRMGRGRLINAPNNDVLAVAKKISTDSRDYSKEDLAEYVTKEAHHRGWDALSKRMCDLLERCESPRMSTELEHAEELLEEHQEAEE